jgi:hypothetical protein
MPDQPLMTPEERRLRKLVLDRRELDRRIENQVRRCRAGGSGWAAVGAALGVTTQGAQQRYADRVGGAAPTAPR